LLPLELLKFCLQTLCSRLSIGRTGMSHPRSSTPVPPYGYGTRSAVIQVTQLSRRSLDFCSQNMRLRACSYRPCSGYRSRGQRQ
jgi:hypothetical protein